MNEFAAASGDLVQLAGHAPVRVRVLDAGPRWRVAIAADPGATVACRWVAPITGPGDSRREQRQTDPVIATAEKRRTA